MLQSLLVRPRMGPSDPNNLKVGLPDKWRPYVVRVVVTVAEHDPVAGLLLAWREELRAVVERTEAQEARLDELTTVLRVLSVALPEDAQ